jgi:hypothetical protein
MIVIERYDSREATHGPDTGDVQLRYSIVGIEDDSTVRALLEAAAPPTYADLPLRDYHYAHEGGGVWNCTVTYSRKNNPDDASDWAFDTGGGTAHITHSLETVDAYSLPGTMAPPFAQAINVANDQINGCDIITPNLTFRATHHFTDSQVTAAYKRRLAALTGTVNDGPFEGFQKGEVLFLGASGTRRGSEKWAITFSFLAIPNVLPRLSSRGPIEAGSSREHPARSLAFRGCPAAAPLKRHR